MEPENLVHWFGPGELKPGTTQAELDVRVGGRYRIRFTGMSGEHHEVGGVYREVVPNERLVFSWAWHSTPERESEVTVSIKPDAGGTLLTFHHAQFTDETARDNHRRGWSESLGNLQQYVDA
ncbi:SRPBCC domain-containing protein [Bradyrhizobium sp. SK17]|nr:SRPBCC domain-containing protein [Bradyrhizobium sp. SK17]